MNRLLRIVHLAALSVALALCFAVDVALAQGATASAEPWFQPLVMPVVTVIGLALSLLGAVLAEQLRRKTGVDIDTGQRQQLHAALMTGMRAYLRSIGWLPGQPVVDEDAAVKFAAGFARTYSPDAVKRFKIDDPANDRSLLELAGAYLPTVNPATAPIPDAVKPTPAGPVKTDAAQAAK